MDFIHTIELVLIILGIVMLPYGLYEIWKGDGSVKVKLILIAVSLGLFIAEFFLTM
ncbi:MAG: hypothetical protein ACP5HQ_03715 [Thermoprotei archaeon]